MGELTKLFPQINQINPSIELNIHHHLKNMIKFHLKDNPPKYKEMLTMLSEILYNKNYEGLSYKERTELQINGMEQLLEHKTHEVKLTKMRQELVDQKIELKDQLIEILNYQIQLRKQLIELEKTTKENMK